MYDESKNTQLTNRIERVMNNKNRVYYVYDECKQHSHDMKARAKAPDRLKKIDSPKQPAEAQLAADTQR